VFGCVFGGALLGTLLRAVLPKDHLNQDSKDIVKLGMGLVATMAALVLALLIASAQASFGTKRTAFSQMSANIILLDRLLAHYGPETKDTRNQIRRAVVLTLNHFWPEEGSQPDQWDTMTSGGFLFEKIDVLEPKDDAQRLIKEQALSIALDVGQTRWLMFEETYRWVPMPFLVVLVFWITIIFVSFGLFAPPNATVIATLFVCALSVAGAIYLILDLDRPFVGLMQVSGTPLRDALEHLGQ
jgi:hypothetical protein